MKKEVFLVFVTSVFVVLFFLVFYANFSFTKSLTGFVVFQPNYNFLCTNENVIAIWDSIYKESSSGIVILTNTTNTNGCLALAYKNKSTELFYLKVVLNYSNQISDSTIFTNEIVAYHTNLTSSYMPTYLAITKSIGPPTTQNLNIEWQQINQNSIVLRNISIVDAPVEYSQIFKASSNNWTINTDTVLLNQQSYYGFTDAELLIYFGGSTGRVYVNHSLQTFEFVNITNSTSQTQCTPSWHAVNNSCTSNDTYFTWYNDTNKCQNAVPDSSHVNFTTYCDFDRNGIIGSAASPKLKNINLNIVIDGTDLDLTRNFTSASEVELKEGNITRVRFDYNFSQPLNLEEISIEKQPVSSGFGYLIVSGLNVRKSLILDRLDNTSGKVCVRNSYVDNISEISEYCNKTNEVLVNCPGSNLTFDCTMDNSTFTVSGLTSSAVREIVLLGQFIMSSCTPNWTCDIWSSCLNSMQTRRCFDSNNCSNISSMPMISQVCSMPCTPNWTCGNWTECQKNGTKTRACKLDNNCNSFLGMPSESESCEYKNSSPKIILYAILSILIAGVVVIVFFLIKYFIRSGGEIGPPKQYTPPPPSSQPPSFQPPTQPPSTEQPQQYTSQNFTGRI